MVVDKSAHQDTSVDTSRPRIHTPLTLGDGGVAPIARGGNVALNGSQLVRPNLFLVGKIKSQAVGLHQRPSLDTKKQPKKT